MLATLIKDVKLTGFVPKRKIEKNSKHVTNTLCLYF